MRRNGVTLVELIVVVAILGMAAAMFFPAMHRVREAARETVCRNNIAQINLALSQYAEFAGIPSANPDDLIAGWTIEILPNLEQQNLKDSLPEGSPSIELPNDYFRQPRILRCPTQTNVRDETADSISPAHYVLVTNARRDSFIIADAPQSLIKPWITSPELMSTNQIAGNGPHDDGYYYASGFQHGVNFAHPDR